MYAPPAYQEITYVEHVRRRHEEKAQVTLVIIDNGEMNNKMNILGTLFCVMSAKGMVVLVQSDELEPSRVQILIGMISNSKD
ncbi:hypothetical protein CR513_54096, partial [Mucuna pruriens]